MGEYEPNVNRSKHNAEPPVARPGMTAEEYAKLFLGQNTQPSAPQAPRRASTPPQAAPRPRQESQPQPSRQPNRQPSRPRSTPNQPQPNRQPQSRSYEYDQPSTPNVMADNKANGIGEYFKKHRKGLSWTAFTLVALTGAGFAANPVKDYFTNLTSGTSSNGFALTENQKFGTASLGADDCDKPETALLVITVSGELPLVPQLADATHPNAVDQPKYMTEATIDNLKVMDAKDPKKLDKQATEEQKKKLTPFITEDGYNDVVVKDLPLALHVCEKPKDQTKTTDDQAGVIVGPQLTVHRGNLNVYFKDPWAEFPNDMPNISASYQNTSKDDGEFNTKNYDYMSVPNPDYLYFLNKNSPDAARNKSIGVVEGAVTNADPAKQELMRKQMVQLLLSAFEVGAIKQLKTVVDTPKIDNMSNMQDAIDNVLTNRVVGKDADELLKEKNLVIDGEYKVSVAVPANPATHQPITNNDPTTGASPFPGMNLTHPVTISGGKLEIGALKKPNYVAPIPTPTQTSAPSAEGK